MTNLILLNSTLIMTYSHILSFILYNPFNPLLVFIYILGIYTSIINHGTKVVLMKYIDRSTMFLGFFLDLYFIREIYLNNKNKKTIIIILVLLILSTSFFFLSKFIKNKKDNNIDGDNDDDNIMFIGNCFHSCAHIFISLTHVYIIREYATI